MLFEINTERKVKFALGFDDVSVVPSDITMDPEDTDISFNCAGHIFPVPFLAAAMDGVVDIDFAVKIGRLGGLAILNLNGLQTRYENPASILDKISEIQDEEVTQFLQKIYNEPIKEEIICKRIKEIKENNVVCAVATVPQDAKKLGYIAEEAGADFFVIQSTVTSVSHISSHYKELSIADFCNSLSIPVIVGNCVTYQVGLDLMKAGAAGILVGIGPGAACTTRGVLGIGIPQVTATMDVAKARDDFWKETGKYIPVITDGGMKLGGDVVKAFAAGADAVVLGSPFAACKEAPGHGYHWGMATSHSMLPRGTRIKVGIQGSLQQLLFGPSTRDDGSQNLVGALKSALGLCGRKNIQEFHSVEMVISFSFKSEGKDDQISQRVGMGRI